MVRFEVQLVGGTGSGTVCCATVSDTSVSGTICGTVRGTISWW